MDKKSRSQVAVVINFFSCCVSVAVLCLSDCCFLCFQIYGEAHVGEDDPKTFFELRRVVVANVKKLKNVERKENNSCCAKYASLSRKMNLTVEQVEEVVIVR